MKRNTRRIGVELRHYDSYTGGGCRVYINDELQRGCTAGGCGYDRAGTALSNWLMTQPAYSEGIKHLLSNHGSGDHGGYYGLRHYNKTTNKWQKRASKNTSSRTNGGCGISSIIRIVEAIGGGVEYVTQSKWSSFYMVYLPYQLANLNK